MQKVRQLSARLSLNLHEPSSGADIRRGQLFLLVLGGAGEDGLNFLVGPSSSQLPSMMDWIEHFLLGLSINTFLAKVFDEFMSENKVKKLTNVERLANIYS